MMTVFLSGCMSYYDKMNQLEKMFQWRSKAKNLLTLHGFKVIDPTENYGAHKLIAANNNNFIFQYNISLLEKTDILLVNLADLQHSPGTMFEMYYCKLHDKPVIAFDDNPIAQNPHIASTITVKVNDLETAVNVIVSMYSQIIK